jgi:hypothetical protein
VRKLCAETECVFLRIHIIWGIVGQNVMCILTYSQETYNTLTNCMSDGSLGSLHRWRSQRIAKLLVVWIARHIGYFIVAAEHLTHWTYISLSRYYYNILSTIWFLHHIRRLQHTRLRVLSISHTYTLKLHAREILNHWYSPIISVMALFTWSYIRHNRNIS